MRRRVEITVRIDVDDDLAEQLGMIPGYGYGDSPEPPRRGLMVRAEDAAFSVSEIIVDGDLADLDAKLEGVSITIGDTFAEDPFLG